ncbi:HD domain-containing protein [Prosthecomicrobium sp. N25]|uniref:HD domain-containing protein n=1 Tax=Prosthecomicrobium sp. N25 TaxID=3129254 RepID=UPI0030788077
MSDTTPTAPNPAGMDPADLDDIAGILAFLRGAERLKDVLRTAHTASGRTESTAEHSWRLCLWALLLADRFGEIDRTRLLEICIVHDLGEAIRGDIPAIHQAGRPGKAAEERADLATLAAPLPDRLAKKILALWDEYEAAATPEARIAKGLDKLETILQHNQGLNPADFDYAFNLGYARQATDRVPLISAIRAILDEDTKAHAGKSPSGA